MDYCRECVAEGRPKPFPVKVKQRGLCGSHYQKARDAGPLEPVRQGRPPGPPKPPKPPGRVGRPPVPRVTKHCACGREVIRPLYDKTKTPRCDDCRMRPRDEERRCAQCDGMFVASRRSRRTRCDECRLHRRRLPLDPDRPVRDWIIHTATCETCGQDFQAVRAADQPPRFCCNDHRLAWFSTAFRGEASPHWRGGTHPYGPEWHRVRKQVWERDGYACRACGAQEARLAAAHLIPERVFGGRWDLAHRPANLVTLCLPCHAGFDRNPRTRYDYERGDRPWWPWWAASLADTGFFKCGDCGSHDLEALPLQPEVSDG